MNKGICPHCKSVIDHLDFEDSVTSYGTECGSCDLEGDDKDWHGDTDYGNSERDSTRYNCPNCGEEIEYLKDIIEVKEDTEPKPPELNEDGKPIKKKKQKKSSIELIEDDNYCVMRVESLLCVECGNKNNPIGEEETTIFCTKCGTELNRDKNKIICLNNITNK